MYLQYAAIVHVAFIEIINLDIMNYILNNLEKKISFLKSLNRKADLKPHLQSKLEFYLNLVLGYFWNKNLSSIPPEDKEVVINEILRPSVGSLVGIIRRLDIENEIFGNKSTKKISTALDKYPVIRNQTIGHGYSFEDDIDNYISKYNELIDALENSNLWIVSEDFNLIYVEQTVNEISYGISYKANGEYISWQCPTQVMSFEINSLYIQKKDSEYFRISPFIYIKDESTFYTFNSIEEKLTGRTKYNRLISTGSIQFENLELQSLLVIDDGVKRKSYNGTVINSFTNNYTKYIDVGLTSKILNFLTQNNSSVYATLWGHGGVGKTASIQYVCNMLCQSREKKFDYIVFLSAKDRYYNYFKGKIEYIDDNISSLDQIIQYTNSIISNTASFDLDPIRKYEGKILLIFDDFETFSKEEKIKITELVSSLNINHHKVVITTRSANLITGIEIQTSELTKDQTVNFLIEALKNEFPSFNREQLEIELKKIDFQEKIHEITSGRPLFILQLVVLLIQTNNLKDLIKSDIKSSDTAKNFLYDRIIDYLSITAKNMFLAIGLLADANDLSGLISNLKYITNLEDKEDVFQEALQELVKLKIITIEENFFKVYSSEIYKFMQNYYQSKSVEYDGNITSRYNSIASKKDLDTELALLSAADASRLVSSEAEIENKYRYLINREKTSKKTKLKAIFNFASYLSINEQLEKTIKLFYDYYPIFNRDIEYVSSYSRYLWAEGSIENRQLAISIIKNFFETKPSLSQNQYLELLGTLVIYMSILAINSKDDLKDKLTWGDIDESEFRNSSANVRAIFNDIFRKQGKKLYQSIKDENLMDLLPSCRHYVINGLTHLINISIRLNKWDFGIEVCDKIINDLPESQHKPFVKKKNDIEYLKAPKKQNHQQFPATLLGIKMKAALEKKDKNND